MGLTIQEVVRNLDELRGPLPDVVAREKRLRQANDVLLDNIDNAEVRDAYQRATTSSAPLKEI